MACQGRISLSIVPVRAEVSFDKAVRRRSWKYIAVILGFGDGFEHLCLYQREWRCIEHASLDDWLVDKEARWKAEASASPQSLSCSCLIEFMVQLI